MQTDSWYFVTFFVGVAPIKVQAYAVKSPGGCEQPMPERGRLTDQPLVKQ
ncbi:hypothetical protein [Fodinibius sp. SL11]